MPERPNAVRNIAVLYKFNAVSIQEFKERRGSAEIGRDDQNNPTSRSGRDE
jgi:hypothetical protein